MQVGLVGYGYWGQKVAHNLGRFMLKGVCDLISSRLAQARQDWGDILVSTQIEDLLNDTEIQAIFIITPLSTHYSLTKQALLANKHVFVEKPMSSTLQEAKELYMLAKERHKILHCDLTFLYAPSILWIKNNLQQLGQVLSIASRWLLGICRKDTCALYDLAWHALSILSFLYPNALSTSSHLSLLKAPHPNHPTLSTANLHFNIVEIMASLNISWLSPFKVRDMLFIGTQNTLYYNDNALEPLSITPTSLESKQVKTHHPTLPAFSALFKCIESFHQSILNTTPCFDQKRVVLDVLGFLERLTLAP
ncbi:Gfo/Idh/MocA family protein [Helicobacter suis]|uniref:Gfo/Idh/MocA family protein n=1 Tax=Helicobacter suis TaxID=104628 RepID=UPI0013CFC299|nr:Gfo/Idh/MocA family oxidoreductase [Helicobacter suis]